MEMQAGTPQWPCCCTRCNRVNGRIDRVQLILVPRQSIDIGSGSQAVRLFAADGRTGRPPQPASPRKESPARLGGGVDRRNSSRNAYADPGLVVFAGRTRLWSETLIWLTTDYSILRCIAYALRRTALPIMRTQEAAEDEGRLYRSID